MKLIQEITEWMFAVAKAWYGWVGASATAGIVGFGQGMGWWHSPGRRAYISLLIVGLVVSTFTAWAREHHARVALSCPPMNFSASCSSTSQISAEGLPVVFQRVGITNSSTVPAQGCELSITKFSIPVPGLSMDTPLNIKDANVRTGDINRGSTRHFDLFLTYHTKRHESPHGTYVMAPNTPPIPWREAEEVGEIVLTLTGTNFDPKMWEATVRLEAGKAEITKIRSVTKG